MSDNKETTTVTETNEDISALLAQPGADSILVPTDDEEEKPGMFKRNPKVDLSFLDKPEKKVATQTTTTTADTSATTTTEDTKIPDIDSKELDNLLNDAKDTEEETGKGGRPKLDKSGLYEFTKKLIDAKKLIPFDDDKDLKDYTVADYEELFEANDSAKTEKLQQEVASGFFDSLPEKLKTAAAYAANGGTDLKGIFRALAEAEETAELDTSTDHGQESITRQYLQSTNFGSAEEIQEQIDEWKDQGIIEKKAGQFKPKLDALQEKFLAYKVQEQENLRRQQQEQANQYMSNVYEVLEPGELNGIKIDKKIQGMIYSGLTQPNYPSISGKKTNLLGHLLEKYQWVEPRHDLVAEALWLLADPDGYKSKIKEGGKKEATATTVRTLKTEEKNKIASTIASEEPDEDNKKVTIPRPGKNFFARK